MDYKLALMTGIDIPVPELQLIFHQPTIKEISFIGEQDFFIGLQTVLVTKDMLIMEDNFLLDNTTNFQIFMTIMQEQETKNKKLSVISFLQLVLPDRQILFTPRAIIIKNREEQTIIDENNFAIFQETIKTICYSNSSSSEQTNFNPADAKAKEIAQKLMRGRQKVAEQKGDNQGSVLTRYVSILTIGMNAMSLSDVLQLTLYQLYDLIERYMLHLNWDLDMRARMAGATSDSKPEDWMKNIH